MQDSVQQFNTMENNCVSSAKRAFSTNNIGRKTIEGNQMLCGRDQSLSKSYSGKNNKTNALKGSQSCKNQFKDPD